MLEKFYPDLVIDKVQNIDLKSLIKSNIKGLILDIDNTLVATHTKEADEKVVSWMENVKNSGIKVCIVSNASKKRVIKFNERLKVSAIHRAGKPGTKSFLKAARLMGLKVNNIAVIGDQIFTDVYGGNRLNMFTILVEPIDRREFVFVKMKRLPEKIVLSSYAKSKKEELNKRSKWKRKSQIKKVKN